MKKSRFSDQQIAFILRQAEEGTTVEEVCRKAGICSGIDGVQTNEDNQDRTRQRTTSTGTGLRDRTSDV